MHAYLKILSTVYHHQKQANSKKPKTHTKHASLPLSSRSSPSLKILLTHTQNATPPRKTNFVSAVWRSRQTTARPQSDQKMEEKKSKKVYLMLCISIISSLGMSVLLFVAYAMCVELSIDDIGVARDVPFEVFKTRGDEEEERWREER